jgi:hypothetical protein
LFHGRAVLLPHIVGLGLTQQVDQFRGTRSVVKSTWVNGKTEFDGQRVEHFHPRELYEEVCCPTYPQYRGPAQWTNRRGADSKSFNSQNVRF